MRFGYSAAILSAGASCVAGVHLFEKPGDIPAVVPAKCRAPLSANITCDFLITANVAAQGQTVVGPAADAYCGKDCVASLHSYRQKVIDGCGVGSYALWANNTVTTSPKALADGLIWAQKLLCIQDASGYCLPKLYGGKSSTARVAGSGSGTKGNGTVLHPRKDNGTAQAAAAAASDDPMCSDCILQYGSVMVSSDYGRKSYPEEFFKDQLKSCGVPSGKYTYSYTPIPTATHTSTSPSATPTCMGTKYTVKSGDTCESISKAQSVGTDRLIQRNKLDYACQELTAGRELCIDNKCKLLTITKDMTCDSILKDKPYTIVQLEAWNPTLKSMCFDELKSNLDDLTGRSICIGPPGDSNFPGWDTTATPTNTTHSFTSPYFTSWETASVITNASSIEITITSDWDPSYTPPAVTATQTYNSTYESIVADYTKDCWITEEDLKHGYDEESYSPGCQDLYEKYCVYDPAAPSPSRLSRAPAICTPDRSMYTVQPDPDPIHTPVPIQEHMTKGCDKFYKVKQDEGCFDLAKKHDIKLEDFYKWNPDVGDNCQGLLYGVYVCVGYDPKLVPGEL